MKNILALLFGLLLISPVIGELWRVPLFGFDLLFTDIFIPIVFVWWGIDKIKNDRKIRLGKVGKITLAFLLVLILGYLINALRFDFSQMIVAGAYMARFFMYVSLLFITFDVLDRDKNNLFLFSIVTRFFVAMLIIAVFGFLQLKYFPSFLDLAMYLDGWDPHIGRLLSTWFDPNFIGGYLAFILSIVVSLAIFFIKNKENRLFALTLLIAFSGFFALYLTYSRSGYLAMLVSLGVLALLKSRKLLIITLLVSVLSFASSERVQERTIDAWDSAKALIGLDSQKALDPTAKLRVESWGYAWEMIQDYPWIGIGYNRYKYEINERGYGTLGDHASGGSDSSLLTIWATTGIFGLLTYLAIGFVATTVSIKRIWKKQTFKSYLYAGLLAGFAGMMVHSIFVNSLLFPLMMIYLWVGLGVLDER